MLQPSFKQMKEFFRQVEAGRVTSANFQKFLKNPDGFLETAVNKFVVADNFTLSNAAVKFSYIGDNFKLWFYSKTEEVKDLVVPHPHHDLCKAASLDCEIIDDLGGKAKVEVTMSGIYELLKIQPNGEAGVLLTNGYANIFYVLDVNRVLRAVYVNRLDGGWDVRAHSVGFPSRWCADLRVFSC